MTRLLLTKIPFYKEVILMSFSCDHCGYRNNEIQSSGEIQPKGIRYSFTVSNVKDLNRRIVKSDYTALKIVELDFEIPAKSQKGEITTIEGVIERAISALKQDQENRRIEHPDTAQQIDEFIIKLENLKEVKTPFKIMLKDISGNCFLENIHAPHTDPMMVTSHFIRSKDEDQLLGIYTQSEINDPKKGNILKPIAEDEWPLEELHGEVLQFQTLCPECRSPCETNMKMTSIPHFKDVVIMATVCDVCGAKTNEVKSGAGIEDQGVKFEVNITSREDFSRDVLKSETCSLHIPELNCEVGSYALGGRFTTVEGILKAMKEQLQESGGMFRDSQDTESIDRMKQFIVDLDSVLEGNRKVTLVLDDPTGNSYIQSLSDEGLDENLKITKYDRTYEQNEELGLNDMKTENY